MVSGRFALTEGATKLLHGTTPGSLGAIIQNFKSNSTREINHLRSNLDQAIRHRNDYERIIRNQQELDATRLYIQNNPRQWLEDEHNLQI